jgi:hypothetical protein
MSPESQSIVDELAGAIPEMPVGVPGGGAFEARLRALLTPPADRPLPPAPTAQIISAEDVQREVEKLHARKNAGA